MVTVTSGGIMISMKHKVFKIPKDRMEEFVMALVEYLYGSDVLYLEFEGFELHMKNELLIIEEDEDDKLHILNLPIPLCTRLLGNLVRELDL